MQVKKGNIKDAAGELGVHPSTVKRWIDEQVIPPDMVERFGPKVTRIDLSKIPEFKKNNGRNE